MEAVFADFVATGVDEVERVGFYVVGEGEGVEGCVEEGDVFGFGEVF